MKERNEPERRCIVTRAVQPRAGLIRFVAGPDDVPGQVLFDEIWSNPPIRVGKDALHVLLATWMPRLNPVGHAYLVVQKHLGSDSLHRWLIESGWPTERLGSRAGYRVLEVMRPG